MITPFKTVTKILTLVFFNVFICLISIISIFFPWRQLASTIAYVFTQHSCWNVRVKLILSLVPQLVLKKNAGNFLVASQLVWFVLMLLGSMLSLICLCFWIFCFVSHFRKCFHFICLHWNCIRLSYSWNSKQRIGWFI